MVNFSTPIILASKSPRRQQLLRELGFEFIIRTKETDESYPASIAAMDVPEYLAKKKAMDLSDQLKNEILIASDTIVLFENKILGKPQNELEAFDMIKAMSGKTHQVITGVCLHSKNKTITFSDTTEVRFHELSDHEISYYIEHYRPFDKAGAYGIQEWIGMIGIEYIKGSYFNVMGLPTNKLYRELLSFHD